jgi:regulator of replication initiation timing
MNEKKKIIKIQSEMEEKVEALSIENEELKKRLEVSVIHSLFYHKCHN